jgi:hypothetical protein
LGEREQVLSSFGGRGLAGLQEDKEVKVNLWANAFLPGLASVKERNRCTLMSVWAELPAGGEFPNGAADRTDGFLNRRKQR